MIVVAGESLVDIVVAPDGERSERVGGSPMNVAVGVARLDVTALLLTQLGDDEHGRQVLEHLAASEVEVVVSPLPATSTATATLDTAGAATYAFDLVWSLPRQELPACDALHVGSLGAALTPGRGAVLDLVRQAWDHDVFISFDPNIRPAFVSDPTQAWQDVRETASRATLVKLSDEDLEALRPGVPADELARELLTGPGTALVIVTAGAVGATAYVDDLAVHVEAPVTEVVDTVGAGDSFMAATLVTLHSWGALNRNSGVDLPADEDGLTRLLTNAMIAAAITCSRRGANPPTLAEVPSGWPA